MLLLHELLLTPGGLLHSARLHAWDYHAALILPRGITGHKLLHIAHVSGWLGHLWLVMSFHRGLLFNNLVRSWSGLFILVHYQTEKMLVIHDRLLEGSIGTFVVMWSRSIQRSRSTWSKNGLRRLLSVGALPMLGGWSVLIHDLYVFNRCLHLLSTILCPICLAREAVVNYESRLINIQVVSWRQLLRRLRSVCLDLCWRLRDWNLMLALRYFLSRDSTLLDVLILFSDLLIKRLFTWC